jgi:hypothetical protein
VLEVTGKEVFVDTSKNRLRLGALLRFSDQEVRAIHLIRDVRGVVASNLRRGKSRDAREAAQQWVKVNRKIEHALRSLPKQKVAVLRYEELCLHPQQALSRLFRFCGVNADFQVADYRETPHHIIGNPMRLRPFSEIRLDERWRSLLTGESLEQIDEVARDMRRRYGYT